jgi:uncharacterized membrane protein
MDGPVVEVHVRRPRFWPWALLWVAFLAAAKLVLDFTVFWPETTGWIGIAVQVLLGVIGGIAIGCIQLRRWKRKLAGLTITVTTTYGPAPWGDEEQAERREMAKWN